MKINYRPEIDGLRAIAIISVILYHAQINIFGNQPFKGGFIGVDIFFVISGYLITSIILKELNSKNKLSLRYFYERRIRRILPALLFMIFIMLLALLLLVIFSSSTPWMFLFPNKLIDISKSVLYTLGFSSNFYFHYSGQQYGAENSFLKPFLHTWSLSVEEQYYLFFPIILIFLFKYFKAYLLQIFILLFIISFCYAQWASNTHPSLSFYSIFSRFWELLTGSSLAYLENKTNFKANKSKSIARIIFPGLGLLLILSSIIFFKLSFPHPSFYTLPSIIGTGLIIWFSNKDEIVTKILSSKFLVKIGLVSYSLYLWHYPLFTLDRILNFSDQNILKKIFVFMSIVFLSIFSYNFIEKKARNQNTKFKLILNSILITTFSIIFICISIIYTGGFKERFSGIFKNNNIFREEHIVKSRKYLDVQNFRLENKVKVLFIGNSHSIDLFNSFIQNQHLFNNYEFVRFGKNFATGFRFEKDLTNKEIDRLENSNIFKKSDVIIISNYFYEEESFDKLDKFIERFKQKKKIILTSNSNVYKDNLTYDKYYDLTLFDHYLFSNKNKKKFLDDNLSSKDIYNINNYYFNNRVEEIQMINVKLKSIANKHSIKFLSKQDFQCEIEKQVCFGVTDGGKKIHYDYGHYTLEGAKFFGEKIYSIGWFDID